MICICHSLGQESIGEAEGGHIFRIAGRSRGLPDAFLARENWRVENHTTALRFCLIFRKANYVSTNQLVHSCFTVPHAMQNIICDTLPAQTTC